MNIQSRLLAKAVYRVGGLLSRIRIPQRYYRIKGDGRVRVDGGPIETEFHKWGWGSLPLAWRMLTWSIALDPDHFDHWALDHTTCGGGVYCIGCKGRICE